MVVGGGYFLEQGRFRNSRHLSGVSFNRGHLSGVSFKRGHLSGVSFKRGHLSGVGFKRGHYYVIPLNHYIAAFLSNTSKMH